MKITRIVIGDYHQFGYLNIDLTYPKDHPTKAGKPLDKVCLIGKNGTGKTTILEVLREILDISSSSRYALPSFVGNEKCQFCIEVEMNNVKLLIGRFLKWNDRRGTEFYPSLIFCLDGFYSKIPDFFNEVFVKKNAKIVEDLFIHYNGINADPQNSFSMPGLSHYISKDSLLIHSPTEYNINQSHSELHSLSNLNEGLTFARQLPYSHRIAFDSLKNFWSLLIYQVQQRERERNEFENKIENKKKTKEELIKEFEDKYPEILKVIADKWSIILNEVGLYFDAENAKKPIVLTDQLLAFIKDKKTNKNVSYSALSSGIKNLIFTVGYMISLYFHRDIKSSTSIFDEPEFSLFPDILLKLIDIYTDSKDFPNTQFFFATHSPLIASQFEPEERVCLHFDEDRKVYYTRGITPIGDDPNDILKNDFDMVEIMPRSGVEKWHEYLNLRRKADKESNKDEKERILEKLYTIRSKYKFPAA